MAQPKGRTNGMGLIKRHVIFAAAMLLVVTLFGGGVLAHGGATGVVKERMDLMSSLGDSMKALKGLLQTPNEVDRLAVAQEAANMAGHADVLAVKFPKGSLQGPSEARPEIWDRWPQFEASAAGLAEAAGQLAAAASAERPVLMARFAAVAKTCSSCHRDFRVKK